MSRLFQVIAFWLLSFGFIQLAIAQEAESDSSAGLPEKYAKDYLVAASTMSPDKKFAVIYPKFSDELDTDKIKDSLVQFEPFAVIAALDTPEPYFQNESNSGLSAEWSKDESVALVTFDGKWGPKDVLLLELRDGKLSRATKLMDKVRELLLPNYRKTKPKAKPYNKNFDFIFTHLSAVDEAGLVKIEAGATTSPTAIGMTGPIWEGEVKAIWDVARAKFISQKISGEVRRHGRED